MRRLIGWLLVVLGVLASGLTGMLAADAATKSDYLPPAVGSAIFAVITLGCLGGARLLLRRRHARRQPTLEWDPCPGDGWLPQQAWAELPDVLPRRPRLGPCPPAPSVGVPPDGLLRRLWLVRTELTFDQAGGMRTGTFMGWIMMLSVLSGLALLVGAMLATGDFTVEDRAALTTILAWLIVGTLYGGERASRNPRRHFMLRRLQRELEAAYAAAPGPIPVGATVRLGDPTPRYDPDRSQRQRVNALDL
ncbi:MAG: hypothetical protein ACRDS0_03295 [Pseudonocardiaceae bacterium]